MLKYSIIIVILIVTGCIRVPESFVINYQFIDIPKEQRIELKFKNNFPYTVCLTPEMWPNKKGKLDFAGDSVFMVVDGKRFPIVDVNTGYCPTCAIRVAPGEEISASIPYVDFNLPEARYYSEKILKFSPKAFRCE